MRLAALFHDIGKPRTRVVVDGEGTFYNHEVVGAEMTREIMGRLRYSGEQVEAVVIFAAAQAGGIEITEIDIKGIVPAAFFLFEESI